MTGMDAVIVVERLRSFLALSRSRVSTAGSFSLEHPLQAVQAEVQVAEAILDRVLPGWRTANWDDNRRKPQFWRQREAASRAIGVLEAQADLETMLGDNAPELSAGHLHPWVWEAAKTLWSSGHYREGVNAAARTINAQAQAKVGRRDLSEWKLLTDAFSIASPEPGKPRLRLSSNDGSDTFKNLHEGIGFFGRGLYQAIRNPANHDDMPELPEHEGLEQLAAFSVLARWVDSATIESAQHSGRASGR